MPRHRTVVSSGATYHVCTNGQERPYLKTWEMTQAERDEVGYAFDAVGRGDGFEHELQERFFRYRGSIYDVLDGFEWSDRMRAIGWDELQTSSFFDGVVVRHFDVDGNQLEGVVVGHIYWD